MKDLENNKIVAAVLVAGLIALFTGKVADSLYHPVSEPEKRGFVVEVTEASLETGTQTAKKEVKEEVIDINALMASANLDSGRKGFKKCSACHTAEPGGKHRIGPSLAGVVGTKIARHSDYKYSKALMGKEGSWNYNQLFEFLKKPKSFAPGTKMTFAGMKKPQDIADMVAFLESIGK